MTILQLPALDPAPLPAPAWLFHLLLVLTFFIHVLFMNVTLGGTVIAALHGLLAKSGDAPGRRLGRLLVGFLPTSISFTITTGVAPLLFIQVLYAQFFYPATILVGWIWLGLLVLLLAGYFCVYLYKYSAGAGGIAAWQAVSGLCFLAIASIQTLVNVLQLTPSRWIAVATGGQPICADPTMFPRLLHFILGSVAVAGLFLAVLAVEKEHRRPDSLNRWLAQQGVRWALIATALQVVDGFWFLFVLPRSVQAAVMGGQASETTLFVSGISLGLLTLILLSRIVNPIRERWLMRIATVGLVLTLFSMVMLRDAVRGLYLAPLIRLRELPTRTQVDVLILFLVVFVLGLATVGWMVRTVARQRRTGA
jgi:hypothetical protein